MKFTNWIAIVGALVSALGALAAWVASRHTRAISANGQIGAILIQLNQIFVDQPEMRPYFIEGGELPKGQEQKAKALASMYLNILDTVWSMKSIMNAKEQLAWTKYIRHQIKSVPIINNLYESQKEWYPNLIKIVNDV